MCVLLWLVANHQQQLRSCLLLVRKGTAQNPAKTCFCVDLQHFAVVNVPPEGPERLRRLISIGGESGSEMRRDDMHKHTRASARARVQRNQSTAGCIGFIHLAGALAGGLRHYGAGCEAQYENRKCPSSRLRSTDMIIMHIYHIYAYISYICIIYVHINVYMSTRM